MLLNRRGGSNEYPQSILLSRNMKNNVYPCKRQFYYIQVGFKGTKSYRYIFVMGGKKFLKAFSHMKVYPFSLNTCVCTDFPRIKVPLQHYGVVNALTRHCLFVVAVAVVDVLLLFCLYCNVTMILIFIIIIITILTIIRFVVVIIIIIIITIIYRFCLLLLLLFIYLFIINDHMFVTSASLSVMPMQTRSGTSRAQAATSKTQAGTSKKGRQSKKRRRLAPPGYRARSPPRRKSKAEEERNLQVSLLL